MTSILQDTPLFAGKSHLSPHQNKGGSNDFFDFNGFLTIANSKFRKVHQERLE